MDAVNEYARREFQFTRPRGARQTATLGAPPFRSFNSRAHVGRDQKLTPCPVCKTAVSIHAPTWGATVPEVKGSPASRFQFTRPRGARPTITVLGVKLAVFQFTRPRGARLATNGASRAASSCFNSRAHVGRDTPACSPGFKAVTSFNSRAHVGRDRDVGVVLRRRAFQFTRPRGARLLVSRGPVVRAGFNSRAHVGRDFAGTERMRLPLAFQFTRPRGARR